MENKDNIGDFFRNNLNKSDNSSDGWDKPDASVWLNAQEEIFAESPSKKRSFLWLWLLAFLLFAGGIGGYIWSLKKQITDLESTIQQQEIASRKQGEETINLEQELVLSKQDYSEKLDKSKLERATILKVIEQLEIALKVKESNVFILEKERTILENNLKNYANQLEEKTTILAEQKVQNLRQKEQVKPVHILEKSINSLVVEDLTKISDFNISTIKKNKENKRKKWKIAYDYSFLNLKMPAVNAEKEESKSVFNVENNVYLAPTHSLSVAYSPKKNWYIKAGFQQTNGKTERVWKVSEDYDKSTEYINEEGALTNDLVYAFSTPYSAHDGAIKVEIEEEIELEDKDNLFAQISDYQTFDYKKINLGVEYMLGKQKLHWQLQGGLSWNHLRFREYFSEAEVKVNGELLPITKIDIAQKSQEKKSFLGFYSGVVLQYDIAPKWSLGASLNYNFNLINNQNKEFTASDLLVREVGLGVTYHF